MSDTLFARWQFFQHEETSGHRWTWRHLALDGSIVETSDPAPSYGGCVLDAIKHGFKPSNHDWTIVTTDCVTHFKAGAGRLTPPEDSSPPAAPPQSENRIANVSDLLRNIPPRRKNTPGR